MNKIRYKFFQLIDNKIKSQHGDVVWDKSGKWQKYNGNLKMCQSGFHCSKEKYQAFSYIQGEVLAQMEVKGKHLSENDKEVWSEMRVVKLWKWQKKDSVALAIYAAELVLPNFEKEYPNDKRPREAIEAAKKVLFEDMEENRAAAVAAASAWAAVRSAVRSERWAAAVRSELTIIKKISEWMKKRKLDNY